MYRILTYSSSANFVTKKDPADIEKEIQILLVKKLRKLKASSIEKSNHQVSFTAGMFRSIGDWNLLKAITMGEIDTSINGQSIQVLYKINFLERFIFVLLISFIAVYTSELYFDFVLPFVFLMWFGMSSIIAIIRFSGFINQTIMEVVDQEIPEISEEQIAWMMDGNRCPACGYAVNQTDIDCPSCELRLK